jgi:Tfp pilus assembly protein PilN
MTANGHKSLKWNHESHEKTRNFSPQNTQKKQNASPPGRQSPKGLIDGKRNKP